ncbi:MAG: UDP-N-acetylmuramate dehydrogenase [Cyclobacteriaceae bacterium]|nr:UDP-N-acetylmuramate dehydrogenase [Cyclobacteriaceae bacterium]
MEIKHNFSLQKLNTFGLPVLTKRYAALKSVDDIHSFLRLHKTQDELLILGGGSNLLFTRDFEGTTVKIDLLGIHVVKEDQGFYWVKAGAGVNWNDFVESCIKADMAGVENLSLIPGTVGAAPVQNIGAYGVEIKDILEAVEAIEISTGEKYFFRNHECRFGYRDSIFKNEWKDRFVITNVALRLRKSPVPNTSYGQIAELLDSKGIKNPGIREVSDAVIQIRRSKLPDPEVMGNAGSFFKNPIATAETFAAIKNNHPAINGFEQEDGNVKLSAAWLIDQCGLKGFTVGGAAVHEKQPLVIVNKNQATGQEILELAKKVQASVMEKFHIHLELEVRII